MPNSFRDFKNIMHFLRSSFDVIRNGYPARKLIVIGVTGTDGKTTTSHLIYELLRSQGYPCALISTLNAYVKEKVINTGYHVTTPDSKTLQPLIKNIVGQKTKYLVIEATSHGLDQNRLLGCNFWGGVLTNITHEHIDYHKTFKDYKKAKAKLFKRVKVAVLNRDDPSYNFFSSLVRNDCKVVSYSLKRSACYKATIIHETINYTKFKIENESKTYLLKTKLLGVYNVSNILASIAISRELGVSWKNILKVVNKFETVSGRMEFIQEKPFFVIIDFAHTPNALKNTLLTLKKLTKAKRLITVFGCAGERDVSKRPLMGEISATLANISIFTAEDPRSENVENIIKQISSGAKKAKAKEVDPSEVQSISRKTKEHIYLSIPDRGKAIKFAIQNASKKDCVVILGKGHEKSMAIGNKEIPWSDKRAVTNALRALG